MEHIKIEVKGKFTKYSELTAEQGYCFYEQNAPQNERNYMVRVSTPIIDQNELAHKFVVVYGNADELNEKLRKEREANEQQQRANISE